MTDWSKVRVDDRRSSAGFAFFGAQDWQTPVLVAGWAQDANLPFQYRIDPWGYVHFQGSVQDTTGAKGIGAAITTLPEGYRPRGGGILLSGYVTAVCPTTTPAAVVGTLIVTVQNTGQVVLNQAMPAVVNSELNLSGFPPFYAVA